MKFANSIATADQVERLVCQACLESLVLTARSPEQPPLPTVTRSAGRVLTHLHQLKRRMLTTALALRPAPQLFNRLCGAANQAAALAWETTSPLLVFPCLFEELAQEARSSLNLKNSSEYLQL